MSVKSSQYVDSISHMISAIVVKYSSKIHEFIVAFSMYSVSTGMFCIMYSVLRILYCVFSTGAGDVNANM